MEIDRNILIEARKAYNKAMQTEPDYDDLVATIGHLRKVNNLAQSLLNNIDPLEHENKELLKSRAKLIIENLDLKKEIEKVKAEREELYARLHPKCTCEKCTGMKSPDDYYKEDK